MKVKYIILFTLIINLNSYADTSYIYFEQLIEGLTNNYKLKDNVANTKVIQLIREDINKTSYLPQFNISSQVSYQSDVTKVPISLPGINFPTMDKTQYKINLEINQIIYDGFLMNIINKRDKYLSLIEELQTDLILDSQKELLNKLIYLYLINYKTKQQLDEQKKILDFKKNDIANLISGGILTNTDMDYLNIEMIKISQQIETHEINCQYLSENIELLTNIRVNNNLIYYQDESLSQTDKMNRKELRILEMKKNIADINAEILSKQTSPKLFAFGQLGYGKPGLNMLSNNNSSYYLVGVKMTWNIFDWGKSRKEEEIAQINTASLDNEKAQFIQNIILLKNEILANISKIDKQIENDLEIIKLREKILLATYSKLTNGTAKAVDYLNDLSAKTQAIIDYEKHTIEKQYYIQYYSILMGIK